MTRSRRVLPILVSLWMIAALASPAVARDATPEAGDAASPGVLATVNLDTLPGPGTEVWFIRFTLAPGGSLPLGMQIGPTIAHVESGALTIVADQPVSVTTVGTAIPAATAPGDETVLLPGETALVNDGTTLAVRNDGDAPVAFLGLLMFTGEAEVASGQTEDVSPPAEPVGLTQQMIGVGRAEFPDGPGTVLIERVTIAAGTTETSENPEGAEVGAIERGAAHVTLASGDCFVWRNALAGDPGQPERVAAPNAAHLMAGDGYGCTAPSATWQALEEPAVILRARIVPDAGATPTP